ncbi:hypothetical protein PGB90_009011 [Kerria lacca]
MGRRSSILEHKAVIHNENGDTVKMVRSNIDKQRDELREGNPYGGKTSERTLCGSRTNEPPKFRFET